MEPKTFADLSIFNRLGMYEFAIVSFSEKDDSMIVRAHRGYPHHFRAEITFSSVFRLIYWQKG